MAYRWAETCAPLTESRPRAAVTKIDEDKLTFDVIEETLRRTNLGSLEAGSQCNYERSMRVGDEIGGHTVSGHVQTTATVSDISKTEFNQR